MVLKTLAIKELKELIWKNKELYVKVGNVYSPFTEKAFIDLIITHAGFDC